MKKILAALVLSVFLASTVYAADLVITVTIADKERANYAQSFATAYAYQATVDDGTGKMIPNPETKEEFMGRQINDFVTTVYISYCPTVKTIDTTTRPTAVSQASVKAKANVTVTTKDAIVVTQ